MEETRRDLEEVVEELEQIETQLSVILERQAELMDKKHRLEACIKEASKGPSAVQKQDWEHQEFDWTARLKLARESVFGIKSFRRLQLSTMNATLSGHDCILIMPTGGGKSLCFQLPAVISEGVTLVVSPLISLMEDQLMGLRELGVKAALLNAASSREEVNAVHAAMTDRKADLKLLYVTPEKLAKSKRFMNKLEKMHEMGRFARLAIDEVHCCSQWGHDFRTDYKFLGVMRRQFPRVPILGLTATATTSVVADVKKILGIADCVVFKASFNRPNLFYEVRKKPSSSKATMEDMKDQIEGRFAQQSGIVYCFSRKDTEDVARELQLVGVKAGCYHADMDAKLRRTVHHRWSNNQIQVVVATVAFGMGIDKPDVRFVIHHSMSKSMENYYQESGRAGRDDQPAWCILYTSFPDVFRQSCMVFTEQTGLEKLYTMVAYSYDVTACRRKLIARHFGERWDAGLCDNMCDHCKAGRPVSKQNMAPHCRDVVRLIEHAQASKTRVTALKVLDAWAGKGATSLRITAIKPPRLGRAECERIVAYMLLHGYLREDFHFTPYSTISYLLPGPRSTLLQSPKYEVMLECPVKGVSPSPKSSSVTSAASSPTASRTVTSSGDAKPNGSSHSNAKTKRSSASSQNGSTTSESPTGGGKVAKKRKRCVILSSDDDSDSDFLESDRRVTPNWVKESELRLLQSADNDCILIDDK